jgi:hypothetical protein
MLSEFLDRLDSSAGDAPGSDDIDTQPDVGSSSMEGVEDVPLHYHDRVEFNSQFQEAMKEQFGGPAQAAELGMTSEEVHTSIQKMDAWGALSELGKRIAIHLEEYSQRSGSQAAAMPPAAHGTSAPA